MSLVTELPPANQILGKLTLQRQQQWGVTQPISLNESNEGEKKVTATMMEELRRQGTFESEEESRKR